MRRSAVAEKRACRVRSRDVVGAAETGRTNTEIVREFVRSLEEKLPRAEKTKSAR
jgi:hypothetical protein